MESLESKVDLLLELFRKQLEMSVETQSRLLEFLKNPVSSVSSCETPKEGTSPAPYLEKLALARPQSSQDTQAHAEITEMRNRLKTAQNELERVRFDLDKEKRNQEDLQSKIVSIENEKNSLRIKLAEAEKARHNHENEARECRNEAEAAREKLREAERRQTDAERQRQALEEKLKNGEERCRLAESALREAAGRQLRDQQKLFEVQEMLENLPEEARRVAAPYLDTRNLEIFLVQCGQFDRIKHVWEACGKAVANGASPAGFAKFLRALLDIYNLASGESPATLLEARAGEPYKNELHFRVRSDGSRVRGLLLPGLRNPGGKIVQQALVSLE